MELNFFHEDLNLKGLTKRNKVKQDDDGTYLPNGQSAFWGLNKSWLNAAFGQFFKTLEYIAEKAGLVVIGQKPAYTSMWAIGMKLFSPIVVFETIGTSKIL